MEDSRHRGKKVVGDLPQWNSRFSFSAQRDQGGKKAQVLALISVGTLLVLCQGAVHARQQDAHAMMAVHTTAVDAMYAGTRKRNA